MARQTPACKRSQALSPHGAACPAARGEPWLAATPADQPQATPAG